MSKKKIVLLICIFIPIVGLIVGWELFTHAVTGRVSDADYSEGNPAYYRREKYYDWKVTAPDKIDSLSNDMGFDLRSKDVSAYSANDYKDYLGCVCFNTSTIWSADIEDILNPNNVMELGKNPGLGIRKIHEEGLTGKNVSIAIIDQGLNLDHEEYSANILGYELLHYTGDAALHGSAVTSIAVGKSCGVAPSANVYYIASTFGKFTPFGYKYNLQYMADCIDRVIAINDLLPEENKIRVISISQGFDNDDEGRMVIDAIERANKKGIFVLTTTPQFNYGFSIMGLGREFEANPDDIDSYIPGSWLEDSFYSDNFWLSPETTLAIPMDSRTYASFQTTDEYEFCAQGGYSWSVPWLAGLYALCVEKKPSITPDEFIHKAFETGTIKEIEHEGKVYRLGTIINPQKLIASL
ncbi:MAG: peptidase S8 [Butyrivibrio sp.]|nr:peptidase S8 [Butyrivibrio sp.]